MKRFLLAFLVALTMCFIVAANNFNAYIGFCKEEFDGGLFRLVVSVDSNGGLVFHTFYKTKK